VLRLEGDIEVTGSAELKGMLMEAISSRKGVQVDLARVTDLDVTAVQLLWAAAREAEKAGMSFAILQVPESIACAGRQMGIESLLTSIKGPVVTGEAMTLSTKSVDDR
jgi:ABC-type transporter Mla MlaB component